MSSSAPRARHFHAVPDVPPISLNVQEDRDRGLFYVELNRPNEDVFRPPPTQSVQQVPGKNGEQDKYQLYGANVNQIRSDMFKWAIKHCTPPSLLMEFLRAIGVVPSDAADDLGPTLRVGLLQALHFHHDIISIHKDDIGRVIGRDGHHIFAFQQLSGGNMYIPSQPKRNESEVELVIVAANLHTVAYCRALVDMVLTPMSQGGVKPDDPKSHPPHFVQENNSPYRVLHVCEHEYKQIMQEVKKPNSALQNTLKRTGTCLSWYGRVPHTHAYQIMLTGAACTTAIEDLTQLLIRRDRHGKNKKPAMMEITEMHFPNEMIVLPLQQPQGFWPPEGAAIMMASGLPIMPNFVGAPAPPPGFMQMPLQPDMRMGQAPMPIPGAAFMESPVLSAGIPVFPSFSPGGPMTPERAFPVSSTGMLASPQAMQPQLQSMSQQQVQQHQQPAAPLSPLQLAHIPHQQRPPASQPGLTLAPSQQHQQQQPSSQQAQQQQQHQQPQHLTLTQPPPGSQAQQSAFAQHQQQPTTPHQAAFMPLASPGYNVPITPVMPFKHGDQGMGMAGFNFFQAAPSPHQPPGFGGMQAFSREGAPPSPYQMPPSPSGVSMGPPGMMSMYTGVLPQYAAPQPQVAVFQMSQMLKTRFRYHFNTLAADVGERFGCTLQWEPNSDYVTIIGLPEQMPSILFMLHELPLPPVPMQQRRGATGPGTTSASEVEDLAARQLSQLPNMQPNQASAATQKPPAKPVSPATTAAITAPPAARKEPGPSVSQPPTTSTAGKASITTSGGVGLRPATTTASATGRRLSESNVDMSVCQPRAVEDKENVQRPLSASMADGVAISSSTHDSLTSGLERMNLSNPTTPKTAGTMVLPPTSPTHPTMESVA
eukprot:m.185242 g.185242  ORF g.185242 m.185242 type:complete len:876 (+) comp16679_c17_seq2:105-2732(+)